jgi:hypothetical protein
MTMRIRLLRAIRRRQPGAADIAQACADRGSPRLSPKRFRPCRFRRPSVAGGRPPLAGTLRPAEARDLPERLAKDPSVLPTSVRPPNLNAASASTAWLQLKPPQSHHTKMCSCRSLRSQQTVSLFECVRYIVYDVYVGRRGRQREQRAQERARAPRDRMARVQVNDDTWAAYRAGLTRHNSGQCRARRARRARGGQSPAALGA